MERKFIVADTVLASVLFTDIVGSTEKQASLGDQDRNELVGRHHAIVRDALERWRRIETTRPAMASMRRSTVRPAQIRCALEVTEGVTDLGIAPLPPNIALGARLFEVINMVGVGQGWPSQSYPPATQPSSRSCPSSTARERGDPSRSMSSSANVLVQGWPVWLPYPTGPLVLGQRRHSEQLGAWR